MLISAMQEAVGKHQDISKLIDRFQTLLAGASIDGAITLKGGEIFYLEHALRAKRRMNRLFYQHSIRDNPMEFDVVNGMYRVKLPELNPPPVLVKEIPTTAPSDTGSPEIPKIISALIAALGDAVDLLNLLMKNEITIEQMLDMLPGLTPDEKKAIQKQIDELIEKQRHLIEILKELKTMATSLEASGCHITSTSNPLEAFIQVASKDMKQVEELAKESNKLVRALDQAAFLSNVNLALAEGKPIDYYIQFSIEAIDKTGDKADNNWEKTLQDLLHALEAEVKKMTQSTDRHLLTHPSQPSQNNPVSADATNLKAG
jgi:hypothetical protein